MLLDNFWCHRCLSINVAYIPNEQNKFISPTRLCGIFLGGGRALTWKGGMGMSGSQDPFSHLFHHSLYPQHDLILLTPTLSKNIKFWLLREKFVKNLKTFQLCSLSLAQISVHKPQKFENFHFLRPYFCKKISSLDPHSGTLCWTHIPKIKFSAPPPSILWQPQTHTSEGLLLDYLHTRYRLSNIRPSGGISGGSMKPLPPSNAPLAPLPDQK